MLQPAATQNRVPTGIAVVCAAFATAKTIIPVRLMVLALKV